MLGSIIRILPKNHLSVLLGRLAHLESPRPLARLAIRLYQRAYGIDLSEVEMPGEGFPSLGRFFIRNLKSGARPIGPGLVSPVDGTLRSVTRIEGETLPQVKGRSYRLSDLLGSTAAAQQFLGGPCVNLYLSPRDYHHIHHPLDGEILSSRYIPGALWPVNDWSLRSIDNLFGINERIVTMIRTPRGPAAVVMVGATNVGKMLLEYDDYVERLYPSFGHGSPVERIYEAPKAAKKGERLGTFCMGSSVILLLAPSLGIEMIPEVSEGNVQVRYGATLGLPR